MALIGARLIVSGGDRDPHYIVYKLIANATALTVADDVGGNRFTLPDDFDGLSLKSINMHVFTVSTSGLPTFQLRNVTQGADMLLTKASIDENEKDSNTADTPPVIDPDEDDYTAGDELQVDCDIAGTGTLGAELRIKY